MSRLFSPISFAGLTSRNRIVMPPMATAYTSTGGSPRDDGLPGDNTIAHYETRARNGVGILIVEHIYISRRAFAHEGQLGLIDDSAIPEFRRLADAIRRGGAAPVAQINHVGGFGLVELTGEEPRGPSDIPTFECDKRPVPLTKEEILQIQQDFAATARRLQQAGFDAVEIHAAHGYLCSMFLSPATNRRQDEYGGSLENRARFVVETVAKIREATSGVFPVFVRMGCTDGVEGGLEYGEAAETGRLLEKAGAAMLDVSGGLCGSRPRWEKPGWLVPGAAAVKAKVSIPVMSTGGITQASHAEQVLAEGKADLIGIGRALLRDPEWVTKAAKEL